MNRTYKEMSREEVLSTFRNTLENSKMKTPNATLNAINSAIKVIEVSNSDSSDIEHYREAIRNCEEMRRTIDEYKATKHTQESLQAEVLSLRTRLKISEDNAWSTYAVIFVSLLAFFGGMTFAMICIPVLTK